MASVDPPKPDTLWGGRLILWQPHNRSGYRFNIDSVLLAGFAASSPRPLGHVLDLGAGCGIIGLMLLAWGRAQRLTSVERQDELCECLRRNIVGNAQQLRATLCQGDLRQLALPQADLVLFNPPYFEVGRGLASRDAGRDAGRREVHGTLHDFMARAAEAMAASGSIMAVLPEARLAQLQQSAMALGLHLRRHRAVHAFAHGPAKHRLVQWGVGPAKQPTVAMPPLVVHEEGRRGYTAEVAALIAGTLPRQGS